MTTKASSTSPSAHWAAKAKVDRLNSPPCSRTPPSRSSPSNRTKPKLVASNASQAEIVAALNAASAAKRAQAIQDQILAALEEAGQPAIDGWIDRIEQALNAADSLEDFARRMMDLYPELETETLTTVVGQALALANISGRDLDV